MLYPARTPWWWTRCSPSLSSTLLCVEGAIQVHTAAQNRNDCTIFGKLGGDVLAGWAQ
jgi:hypothetical protein